MPKFCGHAPPLDPCPSGFSRFMRGVLKDVFSHYSKDTQETSQSVTLKKQWKVDETPYQIPVEQRKDQQGTVHEVPMEVGWQRNVTRHYKTADTRAVR